MSWQTTSLLMLKRRSLVTRYGQLTAIFLLSVLVAACASGSARDFTGPHYRQRAQVKHVGNVAVSVAVLSNQEIQTEFSDTIPVADVRPVWLAVENRSNEELVFSPVAFDPDYFAPDEIAWKSRHRTGSFDTARTAFEARHFPLVIPAGKSEEGFVYAKASEGAKFFTVSLFSETRTRRVEFAQEIPGFEADFLNVDFEEQYAGQDIRNLNLGELRRYVGSLPCCASGPDLTTNGDPLNLVFVGAGTDILTALVGSGWDLTETKTQSSIVRTVSSSLFRSSYKTSPISPLYLFGRPQDVGLQKARRTVDERNHLRLWRAPVLLKGREVWVGQISRDIGIKFSAKTFVTHKISPAVDEARDYVLFEAAETGAFEAFAYAAGVGPVAETEPKTNYTDDPYFTDGLRLVLFHREGASRSKDIRMIQWETPGEAPRNR